MPPRRSPPSSDGTAPEGLPDFKAALREVLTEALPLIESTIMERVEAGQAEIASQVTKTLQTSLDSAMGRMQEQVNNAVADLRKVNASPLAPPPAPVSNPAPITPTQQALTLIDTFLDSAAPKLLNLWSQIQMQNMFKLANPEHAAALRQTNPFLAQMIGYALVGPNPYEMALPNAMLSGAQWGMRLRQAASEGKASWQPSAPVPSGTPAASSGSSGTPSSPTGQTPSAGYASMTSDKPGGRKLTLADVLG